MARTIQLAEWAVTIPEFQTLIPLDNGETYTTGWIPIKHLWVTWRLSADTNCKLYTDFSIDGVENDSANLPAYQYNAGQIEPPHSLEIFGNYVRFRIVNDSGTNQTSLRFMARFGKFGQAISPINSSIAKNADAQIVRALPFADELAFGKYDGFEGENKFGEKSTLSNSASLTEDIVSGIAGVYTGFPAAAEEFQFICSASEVGSTITWRYLADFTSEKWTTVSTTLTGTTTNTGITGVRSTRGKHTNSAKTFNTAAITLQHRTTTTNVFWTIGAAEGQTRCGADVIPYNNTGIIKRMVVVVDRTQTANISGALWVRELDKSPVLLQPFTATNSLRYDDEFYSGLRIDGWADIVHRVLTCSANSTRAISIIEFVRAVGE